MKQPLIMLLGFLFLIGCQDNQNGVEISENFNFESADRYFEIIDKLKTNDEIDSIEWSEFLELEGNKIYISKRMECPRVLGKI